MAGAWHSPGRHGMAAWRAGMACIRACVCVRARVCMCVRVHVCVRVLSWVRVRV
jgi:hypothetical protein